MVNFPQNFGPSVPGLVGLTATGTNQATAFQLTIKDTVFSTVASGTGCVLPSPSGSAELTVFNQGANALLVYPAVGDQIAGQSTNASVSVPAGNSATFTSLNSPIPGAQPSLWYQSASSGAGTGATGVTGATGAMGATGAGATGATGPAPSAITVNAQTGTTYTLLAADSGKLVTFNNASAITVTYPAGLGAGFNIVWQQLGAGQVSFAATGTTLNNRQSQSASAGQYAQGSIVSYVANTAILAGDTA